MRGWKLSSLARALKWMRAEVCLSCRDGAMMAKGVHAALLDIFVRHGDMKEALAVSRLGALMAEKRYSRDIWS